MLDFFRRHQRYFFFFITIVIIISFSFFGTYSTLGSDHWREQIVFTAVDGSDVTRSDADEMTIFIATDKDDSMLFNGAWGPNFLNDGVIRNDILATGLASELVSFYQKELQADLEKRMEKEKKFRPYTHPSAPFIGIESVWGYFSPAMPEHYNKLRTATNPLTPEAFDDRVKLYLEERTFPAGMARNIIRYQERQYNWITPDRNLDYADLALFGYHSIDDWFGPNFTRLISQFIINAAILAEEQGYQVSRAEAMADLVHNVQAAYQAHEDQSNIGVATPEQYFSEQLRRLNMDQTRAVKIWRQVLLFRRYFQDAGHTAMVDTLAYSGFNKFANEKLAIEIYEVPQDVRLGDFDNLQKFEIYLAAVTKPAKDKLSLPTEFLAEAEVSKNYPELVQKHYALEVAQANQKNIQARISIKEMWSWEADDKNWDAIKKKFPELALKEAKTPTERADALDNLDKISRSKVDGFAKDTILKEHPEWITQALDEASKQKMNVGLRSEGGAPFFTGLDSKEKRNELMKQLDKAAIDAAPDAKSPLNAYTADDKSYYRIVVLERAAKPEVLTFAEANTDGTLNNVHNRILEKHYEAIRGQNLLVYQQENKEWRPFVTVKDKVANDYFKDVIAALKKEGKDEKMTNDKAASIRFQKHIAAIKAQVQKDPSQGDKFVRTTTPAGDQKLAARSPLKDQWLLQKEEKEISRQDEDNLINPSEAFAMKEQSWSELVTPPNGQLAFYQVKGKTLDDEIVAKETAEHAREAQEFLSAEAQRTLMRSVLAKIKDKNAISLAYLQKGEEPAQGLDE